MSAVISERTSPLSPLGGWSSLLITAALIRLFFLPTILKSLQPAHFFTFPNHWAVTPRPCLWKEEINSLTLCRLPGWQVFASNLHTINFSGFSACLCWSERPLGLLLHEHLAGVCAICAFSQQVITGCSLFSQSVILDCLCWHGQGKFSKRALWQQLDSAYYGVNGVKAAESQSQKLQQGGKCLLPLLNNFVVRTLFLASFLQLLISSWAEMALDTSDISNKINVSISIVHYVITL